MKPDGSTPSGADSTPALFGVSPEALEHQLDGRDELPGGQPNNPGSHPSLPEQYTPALFGVTPEALEHQFDERDELPGGQPPAQGASAPSLWDIGGSHAPSAPSLWEMADVSPLPAAAPKQTTPARTPKSEKSAPRGEPLSLRAALRRKLASLFPPPAESAPPAEEPEEPGSPAPGEPVYTIDFAAMEAASIDADVPAFEGEPNDPSRNRPRMRRRGRNAALGCPVGVNENNADDPAAFKGPFATLRRLFSPRGGLKSVIRLVILSLATLAVALSVAVGIFWAWSTRNDFLWLTLEDIPYKTGTVVYTVDDATGETVEYVTIPCTQDKSYIDGAEMPQNLRDAFVAVEDKDFYQHSGVDLPRTIFAVANELSYRVTGSYIGGDSGRKQGASTIDQQLVKNLTRDDDDDEMAGYLRKLREVWRAWRLDAKYSKDDILSAYLNVISFTGNTAGVQAEAEKLFGKPASALTLPECASIAAITRNPARYNPATHPDEHLARRNYVLDTMLEQGYITQEEHDTAVATPLELTGPGEHPREEFVTSWFTDALLDELTADLVRQYGITRAEASNLIYNGGLRVYATVAPGLQSEMERELEYAYEYPRPGAETYGVLRDERGLPLTDEDGELTYGNYIEYPEAAMVSLRYDGSVAGVVGGLGEKQISRGFNRAMSAVRQTGSTAKPIGPYVLAFEKESITWSTPFFDGPVRPVTDESTGVTTENWPANVTNTYTEKDLLVRDAFADSVNTIAVRVGDTVGWRTIYNFEHNRLDIGTLVPKDAKEGPMALGSATYGITPVDMAKAYAMFGNGGYCPTVHCYTSVQSGSGRAVLTKDAPSSRVVGEESAFLVNRLMREVVTNGTAAGERVPGDMDSVGKTGTTSDNRDHWFIGLTPYYVTASWYGYDDNVPLAVDNHNPPPTLAWRSVMQRAQDGLPYKDFPSGGDVAQYDYCTVTGRAAGPNCPTATGWYQTDNPPQPGCPEHD